MSPPVIHHLLDEHNKRRNERDTEELIDTLSPHRGGMQIRDILD